MSVSRDDLLSAAEDDLNERFIGFVGRHVSASEDVLVYFLI